MRFIERAKASGYFVRLYFVGTSDPSINIARVRARVDEGGHDVPVDKIVARYNRGIANLQRALPIVDRAYVFDNSRENMSATRWVRTRDGGIARVTEGVMPEWIEEAVTAPAPGLRIARRCVAHMVALATYMGHVNIYATYWYLEA